MDSVAFGRDVTCMDQSQVSLPFLEQAGGPLTSGDNSVGQST